MDSCHLMIIFPTVVLELTLDSDPVLNEGEEGNVCVFFSPSGVERNVSFSFSIVTALQFSASVIATGMYMKVNSAWTFTSPNNKASNLAIKLAGESKSLCLMQCLGICMSR